MRIDLVGLLRIPTHRRDHGFYRMGRDQLLKNLTELRARHLAGDSSAACQEFFSIYVFGSQDAALPKPQAVSDGTA